MAQVNKIQDAVTIAASGTSTSEAVDISWSDCWAVQWSWTGTINGALKVQASIDGTNWEDISGATGTPAGSAGAKLYPNTTLAGYTLVRSLYTASSGTGTLTTIFSSKERNA